MLPGDDFKIRAASSGYCAVELVSNIVDMLPFGGDIGWGG